MSKTTKSITVHVDENMYKSIVEEQTNLQFDHTISNPKITLEGVILRRLQAHEQLKKMAKEVQLLAQLTKNHVK